MDENIVMAEDYEVYVTGGFLKAIGYKKGIAHKEFHAREAMSEFAYLAIDRNIHNDYFLVNDAMHFEREEDKYTYNFAVKKHDDFIKQIVIGLLEEFEGKKQVFEAV